ncbi:MAG: transcription elongation factor Spt5 [Candidatus Micrarchaeia archaeon]|jgi:transcriptional antiterminator NusG
MLYASRVTTGQEHVVADMLVKKIKKEAHSIKSIAVFDDLRGYIIIEAENEADIRKAIFGLPHIRGVLSKTIGMNEIDGLIEAAKPPILSINKDDLVEVISGPFKGEKAKVMRVDKNKEELTVELIEAAVPIPVTIKADTVKVFKKADEE